MSVRFSGNGAGLVPPASLRFLITPDDSGEVAEVTRALHVEVADDSGTRAIVGLV